MKRMGKISKRCSGKGRSIINRLRLMLMRFTGLLSTGLRLSCLLLTALMLTACAGEGKAQNGMLQEGDETMQADVESGAEGKDSDESIASGTVDTGSQAQDGQQDQSAADSYATYTYLDMTIAIPASWEGKYILEEVQDGFYFMQKASYEKEEGMGFLIGFYREENMIDQSMGAVQIAYTPRYMYYAQQPTDVPYDYTDESIAKEYGEMAAEEETMIRSLQIAQDDVKYDAQEYILPMSDVREIPEGILMNMNTKELWIARNEIYARHGREFDSAYLSGYFHSRSWYEPRVSASSFDEGVLSETEKENLSLIRRQEEKKKEENPYPIMRTMNRPCKEDLDGDGTDETLLVTIDTDDDTMESTLTIQINGKDCPVDENEVYLVTPNTDNFYLTDIFPSIPGKEFAIMDYGPSCDYVTYFFTYDGALRYLGSIGGFPFKEEGEMDGFFNEGDVQGICRTDIIHTCYAFTLWYYDIQEKKIVQLDQDMYEMVPDGGHTLYEDLLLYERPDLSADTFRLAAQQQVFFMETDGKEWILVKGKDGKSGYMHCSSESVDGTEKKPNEIFSNLFYAD